MLRWSIIFLVLALCAGLLGFGGVSSVSIDIAKILFFVFVILFIVSAVAAACRGRTPI